MIEIKELVLMLQPIKPCGDIIIRNKYAETIPYEDVYQIENKKNKNTMEYNTETMKEWIEKQNEKIINEIFFKDH